MKRIKIFFAVTLLLVFLGSLAACKYAGTERGTEDTGSVAITAAEERELTARLLNDWGNCLLTYEYVYGDLLWAVSYIEDFRENCSWDNLLIARMAVNNAWKYIDSREIPEMEMTDEDYDYFFQQDKDIAFVQYQGDLFEADKNSALLTCKLFSQMLDNDMFWSYDLENEVQLTKIEKNEYTYGLQVLAVSTDYLIFTLDDSDLAERFNRFVAENCPRINALRTDGDQDGEQLTEIAITIMKERMRNAEEMNVLVGKVTSTGNLFIEALGSDNVEEEHILIDHAVVIKDVPLFLPYPDWFNVADNSDIEYLWKDEKEELRVPREGEELSRTPDTCLMTFPGVTRQELEEYCSLLEQYGYPMTVDEEKEDGYWVYYFIEDARFSFIAKENRVECHIYEPDVSFCFAPEWYILYCSH